MAHYKQIITYNFSVNETRNSFMELLDSLGFREMPDQSTWALPFSSKLSTANVEKEIKDWSKGKDVFIEDDDFVHLFSAVAVPVANGDHYAGISTSLLRYDVRTDGLK